MGAVPRLIHRWLSPFAGPPSARGGASALSGSYFARLSLLGFGFTALAASFTTFVLPTRMLDLAPEASKNTYLAVLSFVGLAIAVAVQPVAGALSDRLRSPWGRRRPFIVAGTVASLPLVVAAGVAPSYVTLFVVICLLQVCSNSAAGPYQALLRDLVPRRRRGAASGMKTMVEVAGAMGVTAAVGLLLGQYTQTGDALWLWTSVALLAAVVAGTSAVTASTAAEPSPAGQEMDREASQADEGLRPGFRWFLFSRLLIAFGAASLQTYALFFLRDTLGVQNPARVMSILVLIVGGSVLLVAYPAGALADRFGRKAVILAAGALGAAGALLLAFADSLGTVALVGVIAGAAIGMFLGANWAMATDLVSARRAAQQLGYVNLATAGGAGFARLNGIWVDQLNQDGGSLGYAVLLAMCAVFFLAGTLIVLGIRPPARGARSQEAT